MTPRVRLIVSGAATVAILALVVFGLWAFTSPSQKHSTPPTIQLSPAQQSQNAYRQGLLALSQNQTDTAKADFQKAVDLDPGNTVAKQALEKTNGSSTTNSSNGNGSTTTDRGTTTTTPAPVGVWLTKLALKPLLPKTFDGYSLGVSEGVALTAGNVIATADNPSAPVQTLEWTVLDRGSASKANEFITRVSKKQFSKNAAAVTVNDVTAYYGTNGGVLATVSYVRGRYVFEVIATSPSGKHDQALTVKAASAFPVKP